MEENALYVGKKVSIQKSFGSGEKSAFKTLFDDSNPLHYNEHYASQSRFKSTIVNAGLISASLGSLMGSELPGSGTILVHQELNFFAPIYWGETVSLSIEIRSLDEQKPVAQLLLECKCGDRLVVSGSATVILPEVQRASSRED